jgi:Mrp family chromosome partitioning ATPase
VLAKRFGIDPAPGLADLLTGASQAPEAIRTVLLPPAPSGNGAAESEAGKAGATLSVITAGSEHQRPAELLASPTFTDFVSVLSRTHDLVVLDSTPLLAVSDSLDLVEQVEAVVLCVRSNQTTRDQLLAALEALQGLPPRATGVVVTGVDAGDEGDYGSYAYSYAGYYRR